MTTLAFSVMSSLVTLTPGDGCGFLAAPFPASTALTGTSDVVLLCAVVGGCWECGGGRVLLGLWDLSALVTPLSGFTRDRADCSELFRVVGPEGLGFDIGTMAPLKPVVFLPRRSSFRLIMEG